MIRLGIASRLQMLRLRCFAQDDIPVRGVNYFASFNITAPWRGMAKTSVSLRTPRSLPAHRSRAYSLVALKFSLCAQAYQKFTKIELERDNVSRCKAQPC